MVDFYLRLKTGYLKIELKVLVDCLFCGLIAWLPYTLIDNLETIMVATWLPIFYALGLVELKIPRRYLYSLNQTTVSKGMKCVFGFSEKCFRVAHNDLDHVLMKGLGL